MSDCVTCGHPRWEHHFARYIKTPCGHWHCKCEEYVDQKKAADPRTQLGTQRRTG